MSESDPWPIPPTTPAKESSETPPNTPNTPSQTSPTSPSQTNEPGEQLVTAAGSAAAKSATSSSSDLTGPVIEAAGAAPGDGPVEAEADGNEEQQEDAMISKETEAEILRLIRVEKWKVGTICSQLGVHRDAVMRVVRSFEQGVTESTRRPKMIDPYRPFIEETLRKYPRLRASRLYRMCRERGYAGRPDHFRHVIAPLRPDPRREAYLRLSRLPGEEGQVDFAHFGQIQIGNRTWPLIALVVVLGWSRRLFFRFMPSMRMPWFLLAQTEALAMFGGTPRRMLYDNAKVAVLERRGDYVRFHPELLDLAHHFTFEPRAAAPYRGNEKGRVERAIRYIRDSFFAARPFDGLDDLNRQARAWCEEEALERRVSDGSRKTVAEAFAEERELLIPLPEAVFPTDERREVRIGKWPHVRFDGNDYSVPHDLVGKIVCVLASDRRVRILKDGQVVCEHLRSFEKQRVIEKREHRDALWEEKRFAKKGRAQDRLTRAAPAVERVLAELAKRGDNLGSACSQLCRLLDQFGAARLQKAAHEALARGTPAPSSIRFLLERMLRAEGASPNVNVALPDDPRIKNLFVKPHDLKGYDGLIRRDDDTPISSDSDHTVDHGADGLDSDEDRS